ncbi:Type IV pilus biogenesis protein PilE [Rubrivivax sp. A210]|nr:Type IV pilus biogenesis protein PilE [Rubrivivax sp. A210]
MDARGFSLIELMVVAAIAVVLGAVALPSWQSSHLRSGRLDGVQALMKLQAAQEQHRSLHGLYASDLSALRGVSTASLQGQYGVSLELTGPEAYLARATARGAQAADTACRELTLSVRQGFPTEGPAPECWRR